MIGVVASQAFVPNRRPSLRNWSDGTEISSILADGGDNVSQWKDKSKNGNNLLQILGAKQPRTAQNTINGKNTISFNGDADSLIKPSFAASVNTTMFMVCRVLSTDSAFDSLLTMDAINDFQIQADITGEYHAEFLSAGLGAVSVPKSPVDLVGPAFLMTYRLSANDSDVVLRINGRESASDFYNGLLDLVQTLKLAENRAGDNNLLCDIGEVIIYNSDLTVAEIDRDERYLSRKWGVPLGFVPTNLIGLISWLDAADLDTILAMGGFVSQWNDKSGNGNDVAQLTGVNQPITGNDSLNGKNVITFDGVNDLLQRTLFVGGALLQPNTVFLVTKATSFTTNTHFIDGGNNTDRHVIERNPSNLFSIFAGSSLNGSPLAVETSYLFSAVFNTSASEGYINGALDVSGDAGNKDLDGITIGGRYSGSPHLHGIIAEIIVYDRLLPADEIAEVENYLAKKWGIILPTNFADLELWLDADDASTIIEIGGGGTGVSQWDNKKIGGGNITQGTLTNRPGTGINTINLKNVLSFDGFDNFMEALAFPITANMTVFIVANVLNANDGSESVLNLDSVSGNSLQIDAGEDSKFFARLSNESLGVAALLEGSFTPDDDDPRGITFKPDGSKMYIVGNENLLVVPAIYQYDVPTLFDITAPVSLDFSEPSTLFDDIEFNDDGSRIFFFHKAGTGFIEQRELSTNYDLSTLGAVGLFLLTGITSPTGFTLKPDGLKLYVVEEGTATVRQYTLSMPFFIGDPPPPGPVFDGSFSIAEDISPQDVRFSSDGETMFIVGGDSAKIYQYRLAEPFNVVPQTLDFSDTSLPEDPVPSGIAFNTNGTKLYIIGDASLSVHQYTLPTPFDISVRVLDTSFVVASGGEHLMGIAFKPDGSKMYVTIHDSPSSATVDQYDLSVLFDITTTPTLDTSFSILLDEKEPTGLTFNNTGTKMYVCGIDGDKVLQYSLSQAFDLTVLPITLDGSFPASSARDVKFNPDGSKMFIVEALGEMIVQYSLSLPFDITTTPTLEGNFITVNEPSGMAFHPDGSRMYVVAESSIKLAQYSLAEPFNIVPQTLEGNFSVSKEDTTPIGIDFKPDGSKMYIVGANSAKVYQYSLAKPFDLAPPQHNLNLIGSPFIANYRFSDNDKSVVLRVDGTESDEDSYNGELGMNALDFFLGVDRGLNNFLNMDLAEVLIYNRDLSLSEIEGLEGYLSSKWGVELGFPLAFSKDFSSDFS